MSRKSFHNSRSLRRYPLTDLAVAIALATAVPSIAQSEKSSYTLEEVLVTANKREQNLQEVAASINVVGGEQMKDLAIFDFQQVASVTAGLSLDRVSGNEQAITLRGIKMPAFAIAATTNTVEYYFNEVPQKVTDAYTSLYDIEQIELLRGPQGTLRGRMSPSGAITLTTKRPSYDVFDGYVSVGMSDNNLLNVQGGVSIPVSDTFALRVAGVYDESDDNGVKSVPLGDTSGHENKSARVTALWEPDDSLTVTLIGQYTKENGTFHRGIYGIGTDAAGPGLSGLKIDLEDDRVYNTGKDVSNVTTSVMMAEVEYEFSDHKLTYLTSYQDSEFFDILDLDFTGNGVNTSLDPVASYVGLQAVDRIWDDQGLTQELRIENIDDGIWKYTAGLYYEENDRFYQKALPLTPVRDTFLAPIEETNNTITDVALFTNHVVQLSQAGTIEAGVRYTEREIAPKAGGAVNFYSFTGNASFKYQFTDELMAYVSVGTSFRPGSGGTATSTSGYVDPTELNWESEDSISYEVGVKGSLFDGKVDYSLAAFQQQFTNFANSTFRIACTGAPTTDGTLGFATSDGGATSVGCTEDITYGGDAISQGIELESRALLTQDWFIQVNASYAKAEYDGATIPCNDYNGDGVIDADGLPRVQAGKYFSTCTTDTPLGDVPEWSITANTEYTLPTVTSANLLPFIRLLIDYRDEKFFPQTGGALDAVKRVDLFTGLKSESGDWEAQLFAKNLLDDRVQDSEGGQWFIGGEFTGYNVGSITRGREVGARFIYNFGG